MYRQAGQDILRDLDGGFSENHLTTICLSAVQLAPRDSGKKISWKQIFKIIFSL